MRIEKLHPNQIRVVVTEEDLQNLNISIDKLGTDSVELHSFLFKIMDRVQHETGFDPHDGQIMIQARASIDGMSILVTRVKTFNTKKEVIEKYKGAKPVIKNSAGKAYIYKFKNFDTLCMGLKGICGDVLWNTQLCRMDDEYYVIISTRADMEKMHLRFCEFCDEYKFPNMYADVIKEHGEIIAENDSLVNMVKKISELY